MHKKLYEISGLQFGYGKIEVLSISDLDLEEGKVHVLLGPNGSGKTTLMKLLNRLLTRQSGRIKLRGVDLLESEEVRRSTVYVHQNPLLLSGTVYDNVAYGLKLRKLDREEIRRRVLRTLKIVGLEGFERKRSNALSGGEAQRVAIARALVLEPSVLLLDEPTASVDRKNVRRIEELLQQIRSAYGCTIIVSTHDLPFAYRISDRLVHLDKGRVQPDSENILKGQVVEPGVFRVGQNAQQEDSQVPGRGSGILEIACPQLEGAFTTAVLDYDRIILSQEPLESSACNSFEGRALEIRQVPGFDGIEDILLQAEDSAGLYFTARLTSRSRREMSIEAGSLVYMTFKASSVRLY
ncbi:MAG: ATP-binding cassette domain-containing protein [Spirochaetales bacterium]|nr:ATP-binding cassette domain-containing protein [Spirochaetales bacterium]MCF7939058.1 ATP-binding cassette domain-containing protein [Spirochaetales bacterium]